MIKTFAKRMRFLLTGVVLAISMMSPMTLPTGAQGFGILKKDVHFSRLRPPKIFVNSFDIYLRIDSSASASDISDTVFKNSLARQLKAGDPRVKLNSAEPQILVACTISDISRAETWTKKTAYERQKVREKEVWNEKKKIMEKKDVHKDVKVETRYLKVNWRATISMRIEEVKTRATLASNRFLYNDDEEYKDGVGASRTPPGIAAWVNQTVDQIAAYIVTTRENVRILLPKGKLDDVSDKIEARRLPEALQQLEDMPLLKKPEDEAYKVYILGACYEAMAYENDRSELLNHYFEQAAKNYAKALDIKTDEKYFREAAERLQTSVAMYKELNERYYAWQKRPKAADSNEPLLTPASSSSISSLSGSPVKPTSSPRELAPRELAPRELAPRELAPTKTETKTSAEPTAGTASKPSPPSKNTPDTKATETLTNETIIKLAKAGLSEENIIATINEATATSFDLSPNAQVQLIQAGVSNRIISAMRQAKKSK